MRAQVPRVCAHAPNFLVAPLTCAHRPVALLNSPGICQQYANPRKRAQGRVHVGVDRLTKPCSFEGSLGGVEREPNRSAATLISGGSQLFKACFPRSTIAQSHAIEAHDRPIQ